MRCHRMMSPKTFSRSLSCNTIGRRRWVGMGRFRWRANSFQFSVFSFHTLGIGEWSDREGVVGSLAVAGLHVDDDAHGGLLEILGHVPCELARRAEDHPVGSTGELEFGGAFAGLGL